jgi:tripartite-type tricarboxylate transporter receptor subunit TctC
MVLRYFIGILVGFIAVMHVQAQTWPTRPVRLIVPFQVGGATDIAARMLAQKLSDTWGQSVVVENRGGAGGGVGASEVARATPDGYTLLFPSGSVLTANQHVYKKMTYDPDKDFSPITNVVSGPQVLVVPINSPYKTIKELLDAARQQPGVLTFGSAGIGSQVHLAAENFVFTAKVDAVHVPYKGESPALAGLVGGETSFMLANLAGAMSYIQGGRLRALGVTSAQSVAQLPDVPPVARTLPGFENAGWFGLVAPAGTPREVIDKVYRDTRKALDDTQMRARFYAQGMVTVGNTPEEMARAIKEESARWAVVVRDRKITVQ